MDEFPTLPAETGETGLNEDSKGFTSRYRLPSRLYGVGNPFRETHP
jgi:hypothetical protein